MKIDELFLTGEEQQTAFAGLKGIDSVRKTSYLAKLIDKLSGKGSRVIAEDILVIDLASHDQVLRA